MPRTDRRLLAAGLVAVTVLAVARAWPSFDTVVDDAWISARYARQLASGHGLAYNAGWPPIEGYTDLLWVLWLALGMTLGAPVHAWMAGSGLLFGILGLWAAVWLTRVLDERAGVFALGVGLVLAIDPHWAVVSTNGIETSMWIAALLASTAAVLAGDAVPRLLPAALCGLVLLIRPEGLAVALGLSAWDLWTRRADLRRPASWAVLLGTLATAVPNELFRLWYFGHAVPNTYDAKHIGTLAARLDFDLKYLAPDAAFWIGALVLLAVGVGLAPRDPRRWLVALEAIGLACVGFQVEEWMPGGRLWLPAAALAIVLAGSHLGRLGERSAVAAGAVVAVLAVPLLVGPLPSTVFGYDAHHAPLPDNPASKAAAWVGERLPKGAVMVTRDAGVLAYFVGPDVAMAEIHPRALTEPHPGGKDADFGSYVPEDPELFVATVAREEYKGWYYKEDQRVFEGLKAKYRYLGRVYQHYHRYYDFYVREDVGIEGLPKEWVVNFDGVNPDAKGANSPRR